MPTPKIIAHALCTEPPTLSVENYGFNGIAIRVGVPSFPSQSSIRLVAFLLDWQGADFVVHVLMPNRALARSAPVRAVALEESIGPNAAPTRVGILSIDLSGIPLPVQGFYPVELYRGNELMCVAAFDALLVPGIGGTLKH